MKIEWVEQVDPNYQAPKPDWNLFWKIMLTIALLAAAFHYSSFLK